MCSQKLSTTVCATPLANAFWTVCSPLHKSKMIEKAIYLLHDWSAVGPLLRRRGKRFTSSGFCCNAWKLTSLSHGFICWQKDMCGSRMTALWVTLWLPPASMGQITVADRRLELQHMRGLHRPNCICKHVKAYTLQHSKVLSKCHYTHS